MIPENIFPAHIREKNDGSWLIQTVEEHLRQTAQIAAKIGKAYGLEAAGYLVGIVHDAGKLCDKFKKYIVKAANHEPVRRGSVNHTFAGVRLLMAQHGKADACTIDDIALEVLAYTVGAHHGLFDCVSDQGNNEFERRMREEHPECSESIERYYREIMDERALAELTRQAIVELNALFGKCKTICMNAPQMKYGVGLIARLLLSILIDADRQDTAGFMADDCFPEPLTTQAWQNLKQHAEQVYQLMIAKAEKTPVNLARQTIAASCVADIAKVGSVMRLNIPTGAGKTITSLLASLELVESQQKSRIIYTAPLLSILEQNAAEIRRFIGDDSAVLEHHSNVIATEDSDDVVQSRDFLAQNWSAPVIVTTMVQLLNTMFDSAASSVRRFHALGGSVIVIDEVQTVPKKLLTLFNLTLSFLSSICQTTFVLCSATQPFLEKAKQPPLVPVGDLMPYQERIWQAFRRTRIVNGGSLKLEEIPTFIECEAKRYRSLLMICNKKAEAAYLLNAVQLPDTRVVHLSASMCTAHRREALQEIRSLLERGERVVCISTQVIEAGVDVSFDCVIRLAAGMDSIVQAAGRCNRHGEKQELAPVYILNCVDEKLTHLKDIQAGKTATISLLNAYARDPARYGERLESDEAIRAYYEQLYRDMVDNAQDYPLPKSTETLYQLLSGNLERVRQDTMRGHYYLGQSFKTAGAAFEVFDTEGKTVIVPWAKGETIIAQLQESAAYDYSALKVLLQEASPYTITVFDHQFRALGEVGGIIPLLDGMAYALAPQFYDEVIGLTIPDNQFLEV